MKAVLNLVRHSPIEFQLVPVKNTTRSSSVVRDHSFWIGRITIIQSASNKVRLETDTRLTVFCKLFSGEFLNKSEIIGS